jgi:lipopolysaccharide export system permease protein
MDLLINKGVGLVNIFKAFVLILPSFFLITIPVAVLIAALTAFNRLSFDRELVAFKSLGIGFGALLRPLLFFSAGASVVCLVLAMIAEPLGGNALKELTYRVIQQRATIGLTEGTFNTGFEGMMIYVASMPAYDELEGVFIADQRHSEEPLLIIAKHGRVLSDPETQSLRLILEEGALHHRARDPQVYQRMAFSRYTLSIDLSPLLRRPAASPTLGYRELVEEARKTGSENVRPLRALQEYYKNFTFAAACLLFGVIGAPLGMAAGRSSRLGGVAVAVLLIAFYYLANIVGDFLVSARYLPPFAGAILPNLILLPPLFFLVHAALRERPPCR